eukprot:COSAG01_NODE_5874_length_3978_cov_2.018041_4_plen_221_part_00
MWRTSSPQSHAPAAGTCGGCPRQTSPRRGPAARPPRVSARAWRGSASCACGRVCATHPRTHARTHSHVAPTARSTPPWGCTQPHGAMPPPPPPPPPPRGRAQPHGGMGALRRARVPVAPRFTYRLLGRSGCRALGTATQYARTRCPGPGGSSGSGPCASASRRRPHFRGATWHAPSSVGPPPHRRSHSRRLPRRHARVPGPPCPPDRLRQTAVLLRRRGW